MSSNKASKADIKHLQKENRAAIATKFPKAKLLKQFETMASATGSEAEAAEAKRQTAFIVCEAAVAYRTSAMTETDDLTTILDSWRESWRGLIVELHAKKSPFVELGEANKKGEQKPVMTGYGRNVASAARGMIEFGISVSNENGTSRTYTEMSKDITLARRKSLPEDKRTVNAAKDKLSEALQTIRAKMGNSADSIALFTTIVLVCHDTLVDHSSDGLTAICLALDDMELSDYLDDSEIEEKDADSTSISAGNGASQDEQVEVVAA